MKLQSNKFLHDRPLKRHYHHHTSLLGCRDKYHQLQSQPAVRWPKRFTEKWNNSSLRLTQRTNEPRWRGGRSVWHFEPLSYKSTMELLLLLFSKLQNIQSFHRQMPKTKLCLWYRDMNDTEDGSDIWYKRDIFDDPIEFFDSPIKLVLNNCHHLALKEKPSQNLLQHSKFYSSEPATALCSIQHYFW